MSEILNVPPAANLSGDAANPPAFFTVSPAKLMLMLIVTWGLYGGYWFYKNWQLYKGYSGRSIWPIPRAIFGAFYLPSLCYKIDSTFKEQEKGAMPYWAASAGLYVGVIFAPLVIGFLIGFFRAIAGYPPSSPSLWVELAVSIGGFVVQCLALLRVQRFINILNDDPTGQGNNQISFWNGVWMVIGVLLLGVSVYVLSTIA